MSYYFILSALPPLHVDEGAPPCSFQELRQIVEEHIPRRDLQQWHKLLLWFDLHNLRLLWERDTRPLDTHALFTTRSELEEALAQMHGLPSYLFEFMEAYPLNDLRLRHFSQLLAHFFQSEQRHSQPFFRAYISFERQWRLVLLGLRAKKLKRDLAQELQYEDPLDPLVAQLLAQKDSPHYDPPTEDPFLRKLITLDQQGTLSPWTLYVELTRYRFDKIGSFAEGSFFSLDHLLSYTAQFIVLQQWHALDIRQGHLIAENLLRNVI